MEYKNLLYGLALLPLLGGGLTTKASLGGELPSKAYSQPVAIERQVDNNVNNGEYSLDRMMYEIGNDIKEEVTKLTGNKYVKNPLRRNELNSVEIDSNVVDGELGEKLEEIVIGVHHNFVAGRGELPICCMIDKINKGEFHEYYSPRNGYMREVKEAGLDYRRAFLASYYQSQKEGKEKVTLDTITSDKKTVGEIVKEYMEIDKVVPYDFAGLKEVLKAKLTEKNKHTIDQLKTYLVQKYGAKGVSEGT